MPHVESQGENQQTTTASEDGYPTMFDDPKKQILEAALAKVQETGWTEESLAAAAGSLGFPPLSHGMFTRGPIELVEYFIDKCNHKWVEELAARKHEMDALFTPKDRLRFAMELRLRLLAPVITTWSQALSLGVVPQNVESAGRHLASLIDELCHVTGHRSTDFSWYTHRASVGMVYVSTVVLFRHVVAELFMITDYSKDFADTWTFLNRRLDDMDTLSNSPRNIQEGVLALNTAAGALLSAAVSIAEPALWQAIQRVPITGTMVSGAQSLIANVASMAPPVPSVVLPRTEPQGPYGPPAEKDPYTTTTTTTTAPGNDMTPEGESRPSSATTASKASGSK